MSTERIHSIKLEGDATRSAEAEHERSIALTDLTHESHFSLLAQPCGPYDIVLKIEENRLVFDVQGAGAREQVRVPVSAFKTTIRDYFLICESYYAALKDAKPHKLEAIDMGRRGVHNEGAEKLKTLLSEKVEVDFATARRLFTLVCVLHLK